VLPQIWASGEVGAPVVEPDPEPGPVVEVEPGVVVVGLRNRRGREFEGLEPDAMMVEEAEEEVVVEEGDERFDDLRPPEVGCGPNAVLDDAVVRASVEGGSTAPVAVRRMTPAKTAKTLRRSRLRPSSAVMHGHR